MFHWHSPLDPDCPDVIAFHEADDDPITAMSGCGDEITSDFERKHRKHCKRCQDYGAANIEVI
jgi:hypothetical protein